MPRLNSVFCCKLLLLGLCLRLAPGLTMAAGPAAKWVGQDGKDFVGGEPGPAPNGYQDVHLMLGGLPPGRYLAEVTLQGHGHGAWSNRETGKSALHIAKASRAGVADLYFEPYQRESGREFEIKWKLDNGQAGGTYFKGGKADPNLRAAGLGIEVKWINPGANADHVLDRTGPGVGVGPDGLADAQLALAKLDPKAEIKEVLVANPARPDLTWRSGVNLVGARSAEFVRQPNDPTRGHLFFSPGSDLTEKATLAVTVTYESNRTDSTTLAVGKLPPTTPLATPRVANLPESTAKARWVGQRVGDSPQRGEVRVEVEGITTARGIVAAALSDGVVSTWVYRRDDSVKFAAGPDVQRLHPNRISPSKVELSFLPFRDESTTTLTLRLLDASGHEEVIRFPGGPVDFARLAPPLPAGTVQAKPGQDLQSLVDRAGTIQLAPGVYPLNRPLVLNHPVRLIGPGATLRFTQSGGQPWTSAIKVHAGGTALEGFAVRFAGPIRWDKEVQYGPAVIGSSDNRDTRPEGEQRHQVTLVGLDLEAPPASSDWEEATHLVRFRTVLDGRIERCRLKGGTVNLGGGPWVAVDNEYLGTVPRTYSYGVFAVQYTHDLTLSRNRAHDVGPSGKTWRFLVLAQRGAFDQVTDNIIDGGIGPRQDDPHPHQNAPEVILTEAYRLHYEGKPAAISPDGRVLAIHHPQGGPASTGDAVAILSGPQAGQWRTIAQPTGLQTYLLDEPISLETTAVSLATGFVRETFANNTVDCRGSRIAANLVLAGNLFGVQVTGNKLYGGGETIRLHAAPTESPVHWGWSHAPFMGGTFAANLIEDASGGGVFGLGVEHNPAIRANQGRVYMSLNLLNNTFRWTGSNPARMAIGYAPSLDPGELVITEAGTKLVGAPPATLWTNAARINGQSVRDAPLAPRP